MTCIVGLVHEAEVWLGGDSAGVAGYQIEVRAEPKVFRNGPFLVGFAGSFRMGQLLRYKFKPPKKPAKLDDLEYMATTFVDTARACFREGGFQRVDQAVERGGFFLVGFRGNLYRIDSDYQVGLPYDKLSAIGCGDDIALGAMHALTNEKPEQRLRRALEISAHLSAGVRAPFTIIRETAKS